MMPNVSIDTDTAGGDIIASSSTVTFNNQKVVLDNDAIEPHEDGVHLNATIPASLNATVSIEGKLVVVAGDTATCGHVATGSSTVKIGG